MCLVVEEALLKTLFHSVSLSSCKEIPLSLSLYLKWKRTSLVPGRKKKNFPFQRNFNLKKKRTSKLPKTSLQSTGANMKGLLVFILGKWMQQGLTCSRSCR